MLGVHLSHGPQLQLVRTRAESDDIVPHKSPERNVHVHIIMNRTAVKKKKVKNFPIYLLTFCVENYVWMDVLHPPTKG